LPLYAAWQEECAMPKVQSQFAVTPECLPEVESADVSELADLLFPLDETQRFMLVIRFYCDESYDKESRVYAMGGYIARDRDWAKISRRWRNTCLRYGVPFFHAADCEDGRGEFRGMSKEKRISLKTELVDAICDPHDGAVGFGIGTYIGDYEQVRNSSVDAARAMPQKHYFWCFQHIVAQICEQLNSFGATAKTAFIFDQQEEFSGRAKIMYDGIKKDFPSYAARMGSISYQDKREFVPLQIADNLAYEVMKEYLNKRFDPSRAERIALTRMKPAIGWIKYGSKEALEAMVVAAIAQNFKQGENQP
jgi:hypothetical protein